MNEVENCLGGKHRPGMTINFLKKEFLKLPSQENCAHGLLDTIAGTQPKASSSSSSTTRFDHIFSLANGKNEKLERERENIKLNNIYVRIQTVHLYYISFEKT
ncbi:hypothetical protein DERP_011359, partial [Dermatophagoides pteronyssinus]